MTCPQVLIRMPDDCRCYNISHCKDHCHYCEIFYNKKHARDSAKRIDSIMWWCDEMFLDGRFSIVNEALANTNVNTLTIDEILTWLTASRWAEEHLPYRDTFYAKCKAELLDREPDKDRVDRLIRGLK